MTQEPTVPEQDAADPDAAPAAPQMDPEDAERMAKVEDVIQQAKKAAAEDARTRIEDGDDTGPVREHAEDNTDNDEG